MKKDIIPIIKEISEILIDKILDDGLVKDIPIINIIHLIYNTPHSISDKLLLNKIEKFLFQLDSIDTKDRINLFQKLEKEPKLKQKTSIYILELFNKIDDECKVDLIFKIFKAYGENIINYEIFFRLNKIIKEISSIDIEEVNMTYVKGKDVSQPNENIKSSFVSIGLYNFWSHSDGTSFSTTNLHDKFIELELNKCKII